MENFVFVSPNFPIVYSKFVSALKRKGFRVLGIGDGPYYDLNQELKDSITEYYAVASLADPKCLIEAMDYFTGKYGHIDYLESNNEFWLLNDAMLRERYGISTGFHLSEMDGIKYKSHMKKHFAEAGIKTARYIIVSTFEASMAFAKEVGFPVFVKPDLGVGAKDSYAIHDVDELKAFHEKQLDEPHIMEEYLEGEIVSFDGIATWEGDVAICFNEHFPIPVADVVNDNIDDFYWATTYMDQGFLDMGKRAVKAFGIRKRCFHIEFFRLSEDRPGLADKGEVVGLEINARPPGGYTPDLLSIALNASFYDCYASVMMDNAITFPLDKTQYIAMSVSRRDSYSYLHSDEEIKECFKDQLVDYGRYPKSISDDMGDGFYYGRFKSMEAAMWFREYIGAKKESGPVLMPVGDRLPV